MCCSKFSWVSVFRGVLLEDLGLLGDAREDIGEV